MRIRPVQLLRGAGTEGIGAERRDAELKEAILKEYDENYRCYGARKMWLELRRPGHRRGPLHGRAADEDSWPAGRPPRQGQAHDDPRPGRDRAQDLVKRNFKPLAPNKLWVADFTYVSTLAGWVYVAFVIDAYARRILGWKVSTSMTTDLVLDAINQAIFTRHREGVKDLSGLIHHNDAGASIRRFVSPSVSSKPGLMRRSALSATRMTILWPNRSMVCIRRS